MREKGDEERECEGGRKKEGKREMFRDLVIYVYHRMEIVPLP